MTEEEFLARWSRRKRESQAEPAKPAVVRPAPPPEASDEETEFDLSSLPSLDDINAATDITAFIGKKFPRDLSRAALRRAWVADPAIRDFVGLAENAWDFNDPTAMPGFGPLDCSSEELAALVDRIVGGVREAVRSLPDGEIEMANSSLPQADVTTSFDATEPPHETEDRVNAAAAQPIAAERSADSAEPIRPRSHGGALPR